MGTSRIELFTEKENEIAIIAKALGHPARIAILNKMIKTKSCICGSLVEELGLAQATISQHLKQLKEIGLIQGTIEGTNICYCINPKVWTKYKEIFATFFNEIPDDQGCC